MTTESESSQPEPRSVDVLAAAQRLGEDIVRTPTLWSETLSDMLGAEIYLKFENLQFTASFKERGARNKLLLLTDDEAANGVVAMSAGNHAQGVARHAGLLGIPATIVMPEGTPNTKVEQTSRLGADVRLVGETLRESTAEAIALASRDGMLFVHPFDDPAVIAGQGTVSLEMLADAGPLDAILVPTGGGGLLAGIGLGVAALSDNPRLIGVQTSSSPAMADLFAERSSNRSAPATLAEGIAVREPGKMSAAIARRHAEQIVTVEESHIEDAIAMLLDIEKTVVEGAGAAGIAALLAHRNLVAGQRVGVVLTGGNIDTRLLTNVLMRRLGRDGRITALRILLTDRPGRLAAVAKVLGDAGANVIELSHHRMSSHVAATAAELDVVIETRGREHTEAVIAALRAAKIMVEFEDAEEE